MGKAQRPGPCCGMLGWVTAWARPAGGHRHRHGKVSPAKELTEVGNGENRNLKFPKTSKFPVIHLLVPKQRHELITGICKSKEQDRTFTAARRGAKLGLLLGMLQAQPLSSPDTRNGIASLVISI